MGGEQRRQTVKSLVGGTVYTGEFVTQFCRHGWTEWNLGGLKGLGAFEGMGGLNGTWVD